MAAAAEAACVWQRTGEGRARGAWLDSALRRMGFFLGLELNLDLGFVTGVLRQKTWGNKKKLGRT
jgi:hypothetical protein